jgi:dienelactone hydrolase
MRRILMMAIVMVIGLTDPYSVEGKIIGKDVEYNARGVTMKGYLVYNDSAKGPRPGVLVVHEWWGLNDYARRRARMLAELGYVALAVDMYGGGRLAKDPEEAGKLSSELFKHFDMAEARFLAAMEFLKQQHMVQPEQIAAIGYCFGGGIVLNMARRGGDLKGVASFHGSLVPVEPAKPGEIKARILVLHGGADKFSTKEQIAAFKQEMKEAGADWEFISYPNARHSFTNPDADKYAKEYNLSIGYNAQADKKSWEELKGFLKEIFSGTGDKK